MSAPKELEPRVEHVQSTDIVEIPDAPEIPEHLEKAGVTSSQPQPTSVSDDSGQVLIHPAGDDPSAGPIVLPADPSTVTSWSKGSANSSKTWLGVLLERLKLIAWHTGRKVVYNRPQE